MNKSEELAKLLELEQMYKVKMYKGTFFIPENKLEKFIKQNVCDLDTYSNDIIKQAVKVYPDFTKPSNFVKFINLYYSVYDGIPEFEKKDKRTYVEVIIDNAILTWTKEQAENYVIQQAQQTDWEY